MKRTLIALALLTLTSINAHAVYREKLVGEVTHVQCASKIQAPGMNSVCVSVVEGEKGAFITISDKKGNGEAYLILEESHSINHFAGTESTSTLTVQHTGSLVNGKYEVHMTLAFVTMNILKTVDAHDRGVIRTLGGKFTRIGKVKASDFYGVMYAL